MAYTKLNFKNQSRPALNAQNLNHMDEGIADAHNLIDGLSERYGTPLVASTAAGMTDQSRIYVYVGSESGYTNGHWYYYNGSAWADGGVYQSNGINTDKTLSQADMAADAGAVGDEISDLKSALSNGADLALAEAVAEKESYTLTIGAGVNPNTGGNYNDEARYSRTNLISIPNGSWLEVIFESSDYEYVAWCYSGTGTGSATESPTNRDYIERTCFAFNTGSNNYFRIGIQRKDHVAMTSGADDPSSDEYKINQALSIYVFDGQTISEKLSDAKAEIKEKYFALWADQAVNIPKNSDLNDYVSSFSNCNYKVQTKAIAETIANMPIASAGALKIIELSDGYTKIQLFMTREGNHIYMRVCRTVQSTGVTSFTEWESILTEKSLDFIYQSPIYNPFRSKPLYDHLFVLRTTDIVIPHESVYHIRMSKKFGFDVFELNATATSDGVYVVNHFEDGKFGSYFHHVDGTTDISNIAVSSVTWNWIQTNVRYNSTIPIFRTAPSRLEDAIMECKKQSLMPIVQIRDASMVDIVEKIMGKNNYIAYKGNRADCGTATILEWLGYTTKSDILSACENQGAPYVYCMSNPTDFSDADLKDIVQTLHENGYLIATAYQDYRWQKYSLFGFDGIAGIRMINRIIDGNICNFDSLLGYDNFTVTNGTQTETGLYFASSGSIVPNIANDIYFASGFDLEIVFEGSIILRAIGEFEADRGYDSDGSVPVILSIPVICGTPKPTITVTSGTTVKSIYFKASKFYGGTSHEYTNGNEVSY